MKEQNEEKMNENSVVKSAQEGNREAFRKLFEENKNMIFSLAWRYTKNAEDAEDILQETFIKAYHSLNKFRLQDESSFASWIYRICVNCSIDFIRRNKKRKEATLQNTEIHNVPSKHHSTNPEAPKQMQEVREKLDNILNRLSARQRMIFILKHYQELSTKEIAEYMNCSEGSVKKQLFRAVSIVKEHFRCFFPENKYEMQKV